MTTRVNFHFDPLCPWAWQTSKWMREVENVRDIEVEWRLFSLEIVNGLDDNPHADVLLMDRKALRTLALVGRLEGNAAVRRAYEALGQRAVRGRVKPVEAWRAIEAVEQLSDRPRWIVAFRWGKRRRRLTRQPSGRCFPHERVATFVLR